MRSLKFRIKPRRRKFVRLIGLVQDELQKAFVEEQEERGLTKSKLAQRLECDKGFVTRKLNGTGNMTLETLTDFAWALDREIVFRLVKAKEIFGYPPSGARDAVFARLEGTSGGSPKRPEIVRQRPAPEKRLEEVT